jgi:hypothetical protein
MGAIQRNFPRLASNWQGGARLPVAAVSAGSDCAAPATGRKGLAFRPLGQLAQLYDIGLVLQGSRPTLKVDSEAISSTARLLV